jgi:predicted HTH domain antitoxin
MHGVTPEQLAEHTLQFVQDAQRGEAIVVDREGEPILVTLPLAAGSASRAARLKAAVDPCRRDEVSLGRAARSAGLFASATEDELGRRGFPMVRYDVADLGADLAYVRSLAGGNRGPPIALARRQRLNLPARRFGAALVLALA